jgi:hypothetical protein
MIYRIQTVCFHKPKGITKLNYEGMENIKSFGWCTFEHSSQRLTTELTLNSALSQQEGFETDILHVAIQPVHGKLQGVTAN